MPYDARGTFQIGANTSLLAKNPGLSLSGSGIKAFIAYPLADLGKTSIGALSEWTKYDVIFNTCLWLSGKHKMYGGIGKHVRSFQPLRSFSAIMNKVTIDSQYFHLETMLKSRSDLRSIYKSPKYDDDIKSWMMFGGNNEQFATLENVKLCNKMDQLIGVF